LKLYHRETSNLVTFFLFYILSTLYSHEPFQRYLIKLDPRFISNRWHSGTRLTKMKFYQ